MTKTKAKRARNLLTLPNIEKLYDSLVEAVGIEEGNLSDSARKNAQERAWEIVLMAGGQMAHTGKSPVLHYEHLVRFVNINRKRLHKFALVPEPYQDRDNPYRAIIMIPSDAAEKVLVLGWPKPTDDQPTRPK